MSHTSNNDSGRPTLDEQAEQLIGENTDWVTLAEQLDVSRYQYGDAHPD